jgi:hypothetical protein
LGSVADLDYVPAALILTALATACTPGTWCGSGALIPDFTGGASLLDEVKANQDTMFGPEWPEQTDRAS